MVAVSADYRLRAFINPLALPAAEWARLGCRRALVTVAELDTMRDRGRRYVDALRPEGERVGRGGGCSVREPGRDEGHVYFIDKISGDGDKDKAEMAGGDGGRRVLHPAERLGSTVVG